MLKGDQLYNTVKQDNRISTQVNHLVKTHHPQAVLGSIDPNFVSTIESKRNASMVYFNKMKLLENDQLDKGLQEYQRKKQVTEMQKENDRKDYRERVNGVLGDIEKNMMNRNRMFQSQLFKQQQNQKNFIDDFAIRQRKISQHVNKNIDINMFNKQSDRYQQYQTLENSRTLKTMQMQKFELQRKRDDERRGRQQEMRQREEHERRLVEQRYANQQQKMRNRVEYRMDLQKLVQQKREKQMKRPQPQTDNRRHNPITNPLQYHIENPYILKRLERYS